MLYLYNTLSRQKEAFEPLRNDQVRMYCCGLTVYNYAHIGNLRSFLFEDILRRALEMNGYNVNHVMNVTDVGHLSGDDGDDTGEDKMLKGAKREKKTVWQLAEFYTNEFLKDMTALNLHEPSLMPKATDHIEEMIQLIQELERKGYTYESGGNIYFNTEVFDRYTEFGKLPPVEDTQGRVAVDENKRNQRDFALWFTKSKFDDQEMKWPSPWGVGYPGWHIECSAMSMKYLGRTENILESETFDIHCGGIDHIPVHHTNEIAQSECVTDRQMAKYWLHNDFVVLGENEKMAKSSGNFVRLATVKEKLQTEGDIMHAMIYRYFTLGAHYRSKLNFKWEALQGAQSALEKLYGFLQENTGVEVGEIIDSYSGKFKLAINDDLNTPQALAVMWELFKDGSVSIADKKATLYKFDEVLGLRFRDVISSELAQQLLRKDEANKKFDNVFELAQQRAQAKKENNYAKADSLKEEIQELGYQIIDLKDGFKLVTSQKLYFEN